MKGKSKKSTYSTTFGIDPNRLTPLQCESYKRGEGGIRTPGTVSGTSDFESDTIDHSDTSPCFKSLSRYFPKAFCQYFFVFFLSPDHNDLSAFPYFIIIESHLSIFSLQSGGIVDAVFVTKSSSFTTLSAISRIAAW